jgi:hypothetical protein
MIRESKKWAMSGQFTTNGLGKQPNGLNFVAYTMYEPDQAGRETIH